MDILHRAHCQMGQDVYMWNTYIPNIYIERQFSVFTTSVGHDTRCANTGGHTLIINDNTPLSPPHSRSQLLTSNKLQELVLDQ